MTYQEAKTQQAKLYKQGTFVAVVRNSDGTYKLEMPGGPRPVADLSFKRRAKLMLVKSEAPV